MAAVMTVKPGSGRLTIHGKRLVAQSMYAKGTSFLRAAILLDRQGPYDSVVLQLLCQGLEIVLKAFLLFRNYDSYASQLQKPIGHNLEKATSTAIREFGLRPLRPSATAELRNLNRLYSRHLLRNGTPRDIILDASTIPRRRVFRKAAAALRLADRHLSKKHDAT